MCVHENNGFEIERDHLGAIVVVVTVDDLGHVEARYNTTDRCNRESNLQHKWADLEKWGQRRIN